eukprot:GFYU01015801.1.p1 GENE.GFYU01015801.1~~GFYU01015801.1.p1  ORF type:complete len:147 (+),score=47.78 GFYU01015801.1:141-581(+)
MGQHHVSRQLEVDLQQWKEAVEVLQDELQAKEEIERSTNTSLSLAEEEAKRWKSIATDLTARITTPHHHPLPSTNHTPTSVVHTTTATTSAALAALGTSLSSIPISSTGNKDYFSSSHDAVHAGDPTTPGNNNSVLSAATLSTPTR